MNIVIPMAGRGSRLGGHASGFPKPLIEVAGKPLWRWSTDCLPLAQASRLIFVCLAAHDEEFGLGKQIREAYGSLPVEVVLLDDVTDGQLRTVVCASEWMYAARPLLVYNADTWFRHDQAEFLGNAARCAGILGVAQRPGDQWSFARLDESGFVVEVAEKRRISSLACTGLYYFASTSEFLDDAAAIFARGDTVRGEYFVAPIYQEMLRRAECIGVARAQEFWPIGTIEELKSFHERIVRG